MLRISLQDGCAEGAVPGIQTDLLMPTKDNEDKNRDIPVEQWLRLL